MQLLSKRNSIFEKLEKYPKVHMESQRQQIAKGILRKKNKAGGLI